MTGYFKDDLWSVTVDKNNDYILIYQHLCCFTLFHYVFICIYINLHK